MNRVVRILLPIILVVLANDVFAQPKTPGKLLIPDVYLGNSNRNGGEIKKEEFDKLLKQGLTAKDSAGNKYKVVSFDFSYAERALYEDAEGNLQVQVELLNEFCTGDTVTTNVSSSIYERSKAGDKVFFEKVQVVHLPKKGQAAQPATEAMLGKSMKFIIVK